MINENTPDEYVVRAVIRGDIDSFRYIVERYQDKIFSIGMRFFGNEDDSRDFLQEVFIKVYQKLKTFRGIAPFRFWLTRIAYNLGSNRVKRERVEREFSEELKKHAITPEKKHINGEVRHVLFEAINRLPEQYRICIDFYFFWGLTYNQICDITGFPVNTIKSNVFRAKRIMRNVLRGTIAEDYNEM